MRMCLIGNDVGCMVIVEDISNGVFWYAWDSDINIPAIETEAEAIDYLFSIEDYSSWNTEPIENLEEFYSYPENVVIASREIS